MCQSQVCKSQHSTSKKEDTELVEVRVVEEFPPQQSHLGKLDVDNVLVMMAKMMKEATTIQK